MKQNRFILLFFAIASINQLNYCSHHKLVQQLANELTQESYISPDMQWAVLSLNNPENMVINATTGVVQNIPTVNEMLITIALKLSPAMNDSKTNPFNDAQKEPLLKALYAMLEATEIASTFIAIKSGYQEAQFINRQDLIQDLQAQKAAIQTIINKINTINQSYSSWIFGASGPSKTVKLANLNLQPIHFNPQTPTIIIPANFIPSIIQLQDYKQQSNATAAANLLFKQCFIAHQQHQANPIPLNGIQQLNAESYVYQGLLDIYKNESYPICEDILKLNKHLRRARLLEIRQAIQTALFVANKKSSFNIGSQYLTSFFDGVVSELMKYDAHLATLCKNPQYGATNTDIAQSAQWATMSKVLAVGGVLAVAAGTAAVYSYGGEKSLQYAKDWFARKPSTPSDQLVQLTPIDSSTAPSQSAQENQIDPTYDWTEDFKDQLPTPQEQAKPVDDIQPALDYQEALAAHKAEADKAETARLHQQLKEFQDQSAEIARRNIEIQKKLAAEQQARDELQAHNELMTKIGIGAAGLGVLGLGAINSATSQPTKVPDQKSKGSILMNAAQRHAHNQTPFGALPQYTQQTSSQSEPQPQKSTTKRNLDGSKIITHEYADGTSMQVFVDKDWKVEYKVKIDTRQIPYLLTFMTDQDQKFLVRKIYSDESLSETKFNPTTGDLIDITYSNKVDESHPPIENVYTLDQLAIGYLNFQLEPGATQESIEKRYKSLISQHGNNPESLKQIHDDTRMLLLHVTHPDSELTLAINNRYQKLLPEYTQATLQESQPQLAVVTPVQPMLTGRLEDMRYYGGNEVKGGDFGDIN